MVAASAFLRTAVARHKYKLAVLAGGTATWIRPQFSLWRDERKEKTLWIRMDEIQPVERNLSPASQSDDKRVELRDFCNAIRAAARDDSINGVVFTTDGDGIENKYSLADLEEIRRAFQTVQDSGKSLKSFHHTIPGLKTLYCSTAASTSVIHPRGSVAATGLSKRFVYAHSMLERHGVQVEVFKQGRFKSGPSLFSASHSTRAERENALSVQKSLHETLWENSCCRYSPDVRKECEGSLKRIFATITQISAHDAEELGLVSGIADLYVPECFEAAVGDHIELPQYVQRLATKRAWKERRDQLQLFVRHFLASVSHQSTFLALDGVCTTTDGYWDGAFDPSFGFGDSGVYRPSQMMPRIPIVFVCEEISPNHAHGVVDSIRKIRFQIERGHNIKHVILRVSSPGGDLGSSQMISEELKQLSVPVTVSFGDTAASGGYWISAFADRIFSNEMSETGSSTYWRARVLFVPCVLCSF